MTHTTASGDITYARVAAIALPVVLSNAMVPLQGAIDTAIIGNLGEARYLAAVALGATIIHLLFAAFNFLQMGVSGLTAQALGADDRRRVMNTLARAGVIALIIAGLLILFKGPLRAGALGLFEGSAGAEALGGAYVDIRIWGAPAELVNYALLGWFAGQGLTRRMFEMQVVTSLTNIALNLIFVLGFGWGVEGVALGTVLAAFTGLGIGLWRVRQRAAQVGPPGWRFDWARILNPAELTQVMALNRDIFIRTMLLTGSFAWMTRLGSTQGDLVLAANGILLQFLYIASHALDGFALAAEALVGQALGAGSRSRLRRAVVVSSISAVALAAVIALAATLISDPVIRLFTNVAGGSDGLPAGRHLHRRYRGGDDAQCHDCRGGGLLPAGLCDDRGVRQSWAVGRDLGLYGAAGGDAGAGLSPAGVAGENWLKPAIYQAPTCGLFLTY
jgi:MATE family multidrug resistance protein